MSDYPAMHWDADAGQWVPPASQPAETQRHGDPGASGPGLALAQTGEDDDTDYDYYDAPSGVRPAGSRRFSPSLIFRTWHHRPGRGSVRPDKETP
jgi:hypothetical protein